MAFCTKLKTQLVLVLVPIWILLSIRNANAQHVFSGGCQRYGCITAELELNLSDDKGSLDFQ